jgi:integrase
MPEQIESEYNLAATATRKRGASMSRRVGQAGTVLKRGDRYYGRYWIDTPDGRKQKTVPLGICQTKTAARQRLRDHISTTGVNSTEQFHANTAPGVSFKTQSVAWMNSLATRRRRPVKQATLDNWQQALNKWLLPAIGELPLVEVNNSHLKALVEKMTETGLSAQSIVNYTRPVKMVLASAVDENGNQLFPRTWNHDFCGLPIIDRAKQHRQTITADEAEALLGNLRGRYLYLVALLLVTGMRIGEALGVHVEDFGEGCRTLRVQQSVYGLDIQSPKTSNARRVIDIPGEFAAFFARYIAGRSGLVFHSASGRPLSQRNVLRELHNAGSKTGFHAFRRFRDVTLKQADCPLDLINQWMGWSGQGMSDLYGTGLQKNEARRREWAERIGLGFKIGDWFHMVSQNVVAIRRRRAA